MVHFNIPIHKEHEAPKVFNDPCQHAFVLLGDETIFGVHMTQYHCEKHKYQVILRIELEEDAAKEYRRQRELYPNDTFVLCNGERPEEKFSVPALGALNVSIDGKERTFRGNIFHGFRPPPEPEPANWFPWELDLTIPVIADVDVKVERVVMFRPFAHHEICPPHPTYFLFGKGDEAHMTNIQTAQLVSGPFGPPLFGIDVDHVMSLDEPVSWLHPDMLEAGTKVSLPMLNRKDPETGQPVIQEDPPFERGDPFQVLYRGIGEPWSLVAGQSFLWGGAVCNSPGFNPPPPGTSLRISPMPKRYWV